MINELYQLSLSLKKYELLQPTTHPDMKKLGKSSLLMFELDTKGTIRNVRLSANEDAAQLWKHSKSNNYSFPAIRVQKPLLRESESMKIDDKQWSKAKISEKIQLLSRLDFKLINLRSNYIYISDWSFNALGRVMTDDSPRLAALRALLEIFPKKEQADAFKHSLADFLCEFIQTCNNELMINSIKELLAGKFDRKKNMYTSSCLTYFDMAEAERFDNLVASRETELALADLLNDNSAESKTVSPLSGKEIGGIGNKYPNPNLPVIGLTYLYSKKSDVPCLTRYNMTGADAFQVGKSEINAINDALAFLTAPERRGRTWTSLTNSNREKPNLLLVYLSDAPDNAAYLAKVLGDASDDEDDEFQDKKESLYESLCRQVIGEIDKVISRQPQTQVKMIIIEMLDTGRKQVMYEKFLTAERFRENVLRWNEASGNYPPVQIKIVNKNEVDTLPIEAVTPGKIISVLKFHYGKTKASKASSASYREVFDLYMPSKYAQTPDFDICQNLLRSAVEKSIELIRIIGCTLTLRYALPSDKEFAYDAKIVTEFVSLMSILLWLLDIKKESYMLNTPYNIGQFLKLSDILHKEYCIQVRNGNDKTKSLPPQLMGAEMLSLAAENPNEALRRMLERMRIYLAWATSAVGKDSGIPKWILARFEEVSAKIAQNTIPEKFTPAEQAQLLLGYLAEIPYEKKSENKASEEDEINV